MWGTPPPFFLKGLKLMCILGKVYKKYLWLCSSTMLASWATNFGCAAISISEGIFYLGCSQGPCSPPTSYLGLLCSTLSIFSYSCLAKSKLLIFFLTIWFRLSLPGVWVITIRIATVVSVQTHKGVVVRNGRGPSLEEKLTVQSSDHCLFCSNLLVKENI